ILLVLAVGSSLRTSDLLADLDGGAAAGADGRREEGVARGLACAFLHRQVTVGELLVAELGEFGGEVGVAVGEFGDLAGVVLFDDALHRLGAGMGGALAEQGGAGPDGEAGQPPDGGERGGPHAPLGQQAVEPRPMLGLLALHLGQLAGDPLAARRIAEHRPLAAVDVHGAELAGVVDPQDFGHSRLPGALAGTGRDRLVGHLRLHSLLAARKLRPASTREIKAFQPAIDSPRNTQAALSHDGSSTASPASRAPMSSSLTTPPGAQAAGPGQNFHSTPAW